MPKLKNTIALVFQLRNCPLNKAKMKLNHKLPTHNEEFKLFIYLNIVISTGEALDTALNDVTNFDDPTCKA